MADMVVVMDDCYCDYDPPTFYSKTIRRARKEHRCEECSGKIMSGQYYEYVASLWDGYWFTVFKTCERCCDLRTWVKNNVPCFCWAHGNMLDDAKEAIDAARSRAPAETVGLKFGFLRRKLLLRKSQVSM